MAATHREKLIQTGITVIHRRGFGATGVREIADAAGVPQGSFTNHFRSKEAFGVLVLERYFERVEAIMDETLEDDALAPRDRLLAYFDRIAAMMAEADWACGCLIADLAGEVPAHSEAIRLRLRDILDAQSRRFERALALAAGDAGGDLGAFVLAAWHGTLLRMKAERSGDAVDRFRRVLTTLIA